MDSIAELKSELEQLIGISGADAEAFWSLSRRCGTLAVVPALAAGAKWGPGFVAAGTVTLPGLGTVSGTTAALLVMGGAWLSSYGACMSVLPGLLRIRDALRAHPSALNAVRNDARTLVLSNRRAHA